MRVKLKLGPAEGSNILANQVAKQGEQNHCISIEVCVHLKLCILSFQPLFKTCRFFMLSVLY